MSYPPPPGSQSPGQQPPPGHGPPPGYGVPGQTPGYGQPQPGYGPPPGQPPAGHPHAGPPGFPPPGHPHAGPPPQLPVTKRIPEDQPFIVRPSARKRALQFGGLLLVFVLPLACIVGLAVTDDSGGDGALAAVGVLGCFLVFLGAILGLQLWLITSGGPVLAAGPAGLWIKTRPTRGQAIWLPWEAIEQVYRRRWALEKMICVKPRDPRTGVNLGAYTALDSGMQQLFFGTGFTATANFADKSEQEIIGALTHYAAGRVPVK